MGSRPAGSPLKPPKKSSTQATNWSVSAVSSPMKRRNIAVG